MVIKTLCTPKNSHKGLQIPMWSDGEAKEMKQNKSHLLCHMGAIFWSGITIQHIFSSPCGQKYNMGLWQKGKKYYLYNFLDNCQSSELKVTILA